MSDTLPDIPGFKVQSKLGSGGMATVYLATQDGFERPVALKLLKGTEKEDRGAEQFRVRFYREARTIGKLDHPGITPVYHFGEHNGQLYLAMQYLAGGDLDQRISQGNLSPNQCLSWLRDIADALAKAHEAGITHRDIKPENILFDTDDNLKLADFGIARQAGEESTLTTGFVIGTVAYMSPEQMDGNSEIDPRADLYSLGVVFYEMLTGQRAYPPEPFQATYLAKLQSPLQLPKELKEFQPLLERLVAPDRDNRFPDARTLVQEIDQHQKPAAQNPLWRWASYALAALIVLVGSSAVYRTWFVEPPVLSLDGQLSTSPSDAALFLLPDLQVLDRRTQLSPGEYQGLAWAPNFRPANFTFTVPIDAALPPLQLRPLLNPGVEEFHAYLDLVAEKQASDGQTFLATYPDSPLADLVRVVIEDTNLDPTLLEKAAAVGDVIALVTLSEVLDQGWLDLPQDRQRSMSLARQAADTNYAFGQYHYALQLIEQGDRGREALAVLEDAASQGFFLAENLLGAALFQGQWTPKDLAGATDLLQRSADQGYREAMFNLAIVKLSSGDPVASTEAQELLERAAALGDEAAADYLRGG